MPPKCGLCGARPGRMHLFPPNSKSEVQEAWFKGLDLPQAESERLLKEHRDKLNSGSRPRWCAGHFDTNDDGQLMPKYFKIPEDELDSSSPSPSPTPDKESSSVGEKKSKTVVKKEEKEDGDEEEEEEEETPKIRRSVRRVGLEAKRKKQEEEEARAREEEKARAKQKERERREKEKMKEAEASSECEPPITLDSIFKEAGLSLAAKTNLPSPRKSSIHKSFAETRKQRLTEAAAKGRRIFVPRIQDQSAGPSSIRLSIPQRRGSMPAVPQINQLQMENATSIKSLQRECSCRSEIDVIIERTAHLEDQFDEVLGDLNALMQVWNDQTKRIPPQNGTATRPPPILPNIAGWDPHRCSVCGAFTQDWTALPESRIARVALYQRLECEKKRDAVIGLERMHERATSNRIYLCTTHLLPEKRQGNEQETIEATPRLSSSVTMHNARMSAAIASAYSQPTLIRRTPISKDATRLLTSSDVGLTGMKRPHKYTINPPPVVTLEDDDVEMKEEEKADDAPSCSTAMAPSMDEDSDDDLPLKRPRRSMNAQPSKPSQAPVRSSEDAEEYAPMLQPQIGMSLSPPGVDDEDSDDE